MPLWTPVSILPQAVIRKISAHTKSPRQRVLSGSAVMLTGLGAATLINFAYNIAVARYLGPIGFGHTTAVYTLLILISSVTLSFQILTAKIVAQQRSSEEKSKAYREFHWRGWAGGVVVSMLLLIFRDSITAYLNLPNSILIVLLAIGTAFYVPLGTRRGYLQGVCDFRRLAHNLVLEGLCRLTGSLLLIQMGFGVTGVIAANAAAVAIVYFAARPKLTIPDDRMPEVAIAFRESLQAAIFFAGQVIINNCDIVVVKHFFPSDEAGIYAAVAMVGRVVFAFSWAVVSSMFPIAAETGSRKQDDRGVLGTSLLIVSGICLAFMCGLRIAPGGIWTHLFGSQFATVTGSNFRYLLVLYALSAGVYCLSVVLIAYEMSHKIANTGSVQLIIAGAVVAGIYWFHSSLAEVIWVQVAMMVVLLLCVAFPFVGAILARHEGSGLPVPGLVRLRRRASEPEVIAEFLKNDFDSPKFAQYRYTLEKLVTDPDIEDDEQNSVRRALFNVRHGQLWRELPSDTQWFEAEIRANDLDRLQVFPRAQWRKLARGDYGLPQVAQRVLDERYRKRTTEAFLGKIDDLRAHLRQDFNGSAVLLIGVRESGPFTILDGNHRMVAVMLTSHDSLKRFRFFCGLSPRMARCCWHRTNVMTLVHYGTNMIRYFVHNPETELLRLLQRSGGARAEAT